MRSMAIDRRTLLTGLGAAGVVSAWAPCQAWADDVALERDVADPLFASARREADGTHSVAITDLDGFDRAVVPLPARGHDIAQCPKSGRCLVFARRPGTFAVLFDPKGAHTPQMVTSVDRRHFYGHGVFSPDGRLVYATENDFSAARGIIGVYDVSGDHPQRIGEMESGGIGPHDMVLLPGGRTLVVANGGIVTHPDRGREKLNIDSMRPNIALIDRATGDVAARVATPAALHKLSLRHMAVTAEGVVWIGGQYQGRDDDTPPLVASLDPRKERLTFHDVPVDLSGRLANYVGSMAVNREGSVVAASCPRAGRVVYFSARDGRFIAEHRRQDACGLAPLGNAGFLISDGTGGLLESQSANKPPVVVAARAGMAWDNHLIALANR